MITRLRYVERYDPQVDRTDPCIAWVRVRVLQYQDNDGIWWDVPIVDETHLQKPFPEGDAEKKLWLELLDKIRIREKQT